MLKLWENVMIWMQLEAVTHAFFDELRDPNTRLPNGRVLPPLFNFKAHGMSLLKISFKSAFFSQLKVLNPYLFCQS